MLSASIMLQSYRALKEELGREPCQADLVLLQRFNTIVSLNGASIKIENISYLCVNLRELEVLCDLIEQKRLLLRSLNKVLSNIRAGEQESSTVEMQKLRDQGYKTIETWLKGNSLIEKERLDGQYSGVIYEDDGMGKSVRSLQGGLPNLGKKK